MWISHKQSCPTVGGVAAEVAFCSARALATSMIINMDANTLCFSSWKEGDIKLVKVTRRHKGEALSGDSRPRESEPPAYERGKGVHGFESLPTGLSMCITRPVNSIHDDGSNFP